MRFNLEEIKRKMLVKYPYFGNVIASAKYQRKDEIPTACTDGITVYYNPSFFETLDKEEQTFVLSHEICHIAFDHIRRSENKDPKIWNIATDAVINAHLKKDGLKIPQGAVEIDDAIKYDSETLYEKIKEENQAQSQGQGEGGESNEKSESSSSSGNGSSQEDNQEQNENQESQGGNSNGSSSDKQDKNKQEQNESGNSSKESSDKDQDNDENQKNQSGGGKSNDKNEEQNKEGNSSGDGEDKDEEFDPHSMWEEGLKRLKEEQENQDKKDKNNNNNNQNKNNNQSNKEDISKNEKDAFEKNLEEKKKELQKLKEELISASKQAGQTSNGNLRTVDGSGRQKEIIDWRYVLREAVKYDVDWSTRNCYVEDGVVCSTLEEYPTPEAEIVLDTSGSISETLLRNFLKECKNILDHSRVKVGCFDTRFYGFTEIRNEADIEKMKFQGGGGTDFDVAVNAFTRRVENKIIFTDGYAPMPQQPMDAIWVVFGEDEIKPKGGRVIHITPDMLYRLQTGRQKVKTR